MATASLASSVPTPNSSANFVFINDSNPRDAKSKAKRKLVRAQAARGPHSATNASKPRAVNPRTPSSLLKHQALKRQKDKSSTSTFALNLTSHDTLIAQTKTLVPKIAPKIDGITIEILDKRLGPADTQATTKSPALSNESISAPPKSVDATEEDVSPNGSPVAGIVPRMPGTGWSAPFVSHPFPGKTYIPMLIDHYLKNIATDIPELDAGTPFSLRQKWFPMVMTSPATLYVVLLTAASHYATFHNMLPQREIPPILLHLKQITLSSINAIISAIPRDQAVPDAIIGAVAKMASYEAMFGSPTLFHTHFRALQHMIETRGGLHTLGLDGLLMRMVLWIDINSAFLLNSRTYFAPTEPLPGHVAIEPNPAGFLSAS